MQRTWLLLGVGLAAACGEPAPRDPAAERLAAAEREIDTRNGLSRDAKREIWTTMRADMIAPRHPADGGGRAWLDSVEDASGARVPLHAGDHARIRLGYEAGPLGIAPGGTLEFRVSPWWRWDPPQPLDRNAPGFTQAMGPEKRTRYAWDGDKLDVRFPNGLAPRGRVAIVYGAGPALAAVDAYAERGERLWFGVDGDGDGVLAYLAESPRVDIAAGPPAQLRVVLPATARPGEEVLVHVSVLDAYGNAGVSFAGRLRLRAQSGLALPESLLLDRSDEGRRSISARVTEPGVYRATVSASIPGAGLLTATSNPLLVETNAPRLYWADLHGHSQLSDGTGSPEQFFTYARDVAGLDAAALTDHDHFGVRFLDETPEWWQQIRSAAASFDLPGRFVTVLGFEWTSLLHGHRHVLYFEDDGPVLSAFDPRTQTPTQLWDALRGEPALTFAHHSAGGPVSTNWRYRPDPELEPVTEIVSVHGNSESPDAPIPIYDPVAGNFVRDVLGEGVRLGFIGSGDSHDGHPGANHFGSERSFGLAAIRADSLTRESLRAALQARRVYATNGARIVLDLSLDGAAMGSVIPRAASGASGDVPLRMRVVAEAPLDRIELVTRGAVQVLSLAGELEWRDERPVARPRAGDYFYARVIQRDGGAAWSSPIFAE